MLRILRRGGASVVVLIAGVSIVTLVYSLIVFRKQAQASTDLQTQLSELQSQAAKQGVFIEVKDQTNLTPVKVDPNATKQYDGTADKLPFSFRYPSNFVIKPIKTEDGSIIGVKLASDEAIINSADVPKGQVLLEVTAAQMSWLGRDIRAYKQTTPYAVKDRLFKIGDKIVGYETSNKLNDTTTWVQTILSPVDTHGYYTLIKATPDATETRDTYNMVLQSLTIKL